MTSKTKQAWLSQLEAEQHDTVWRITALTGHELRRIDRQRAWLATPRAIAFAARHGKLRLGNGASRAYAPAAQ